MKKILMPIDGTQRSMESAEFIAKNYSPEETEIVCATVREDYYAFSMSQIDKDRVVKETMPIFEKTDEILKSFKVKNEVLIGKSAGEEIVAYARENDVDIIVITKSTKKNVKKLIGSVAAYIVRHAKCTVFSIPEKEDDEAA